MDIAGFFPLETEALAAHASRQFGNGAPFVAVIPAPRDEAPHGFTDFQSGRAFPNP